MSIVSYKFPLKDINGEPREVSVMYKDGTLVFPADYDYEFEVAAIEFGYPESECRYVFENWDESPEDIIGVFARPGPWVLARATVDWAWHAIQYASKELKNFDIIEVKYPDTRERIREAGIKTGKKYGDLFDLYQDIYEICRQVSPFGEANDFCHNMLVSHMFILSDIFKYNFVSTNSMVRKATDVIAYANSFALQTKLNADEEKLWSEIYETNNYIDTYAATAMVGRELAKMALGDKGWAAERLWQIRRIIDLFDAKDQADPWPPVTLPIP
jgi:hypothetical protein